MTQRYLQEFSARDVTYYEQAYADGRLRVTNRSSMGMNDPLQVGMQMRHYVHRHEPPVLDLPILVCAVVQSVLRHASTIDEKCDAMQVCPESREMIAVHCENSKP